MSRFKVEEVLGIATAMGKQLKPCPYCSNPMRIEPYTLNITGEHKPITQDSDDSDIFGNKLEYRLSHAYNANMNCMIYSIINIIGRYYKSANDIVSTWNTIIDQLPLCLEISGSPLCTCINCGKTIFSYDNDWDNVSYMENREAGGIYELKFHDVDPKYYKESYQNLEVLDFMLCSLECLSKYLNEHRHYIISIEEYKIGFETRSVVTKRTGIPKLIPIGRVVEGK